MLTIMIASLWLQVLLFLTSLVLAKADNSPGYASPASYDQPPVYNYQYAVKDDYSGNDFGASESRDGAPTSGSYSVALPDGRIQTVNYNVADAYSGYIADVTYSGEAQYAEVPAYKAVPAPQAYQPAPIAYTPPPPPSLQPCSFSVCSIT